MPPPPGSNPYTPPSAGGAACPEVYLDGESLMVPRGWSAPDLCLLTGSDGPLMGRRVLKLQWAPPWLALGLLGTPLLYLLLVSLFSKNGEIDYCVSAALGEKLARRRRITLIVCGSLLLLSLAALAVDFYGTAGACMAAILVCSLCGRAGTRFLGVSRITATHIGLKNIPPAVQQRILKFTAEDRRREWAAPLAGK